MNYELSTIIGLGSIYLILLFGIAFITERGWIPDKIIINFRKKPPSTRPSVRTPSRQLLLSKKPAKFLTPSGAASMQINEDRDWEAL